MKRFLLIVVGAAMLVACGGKERTLSPEEIVANCWERIAIGDFNGAVALMEVADDEKDIFAESLREAYEALGELEVKPTFKATEVSIEDDKATVKGVVAFSEESSAESEYRLVNRGGMWLITE